MKVFIFSKKQIYVLLVCIFCMNYLAYSSDYIEVVGANDPAIDVPSVQNAVDNYSKVVLKGSFDFGGIGIYINQPCTLEGEIDSEGNVLPVIEVFDKFTRH